MSDLPFTIAWLFLAPLMAVRYGGSPAIIAIIAFALGMVTWPFSRWRWRWIVPLFLVIVWFIYGAFCVGHYGLYL